MSIYSNSSPWIYDGRCWPLRTLEAANRYDLECSPQWTARAAEYVSFFLWLAERIVVDNMRACRFLLETSPCIVRITGPSKCTRRDEVENKTLAWLNSQINLVREVNNLHDRISDQLGYREGPQLIPETFLVDGYIEQ